MLDTSARVLSLLALLQARRDWNGPRLADELAVTTRTVRKDVERLRTLGYPVNAEPGAAGGYQLGAGSSLPPLLLDDEEAVAIAIGLRGAAAGGGVTGIEHSSASALAKLDQVLPARLHRRVRALHESTVALAPSSSAVDASVLTTIAAAIRDRQLLRFEYHSVDGQAVLRTVEPHRLVHARGRWYVVAWDRRRDDWRTFRADRLQLRADQGRKFRRRPDPGGDLVGFIERSLGTATWRYRARIKVHASASEVIPHLPAAVIVEPIDDQSCYASVGSDSAHQLAIWVAHLDRDFDASDHPALARELKSLADRYKRAAG